MVQERDGQENLLTLREFATRLADISVYRHERPVRELLALLVGQSGIQIATLWKLIGDTGFACAIERAGYVPDPCNEESEYLCPISGSHIEWFLKKKPFQNMEAVHIPDVDLLPKDVWFNTKERIKNLSLVSSWMIPLDTSQSDTERYFLNIYFDPQKLELEHALNTVEAIRLKTSAIVMSALEVKKSRLGEVFQEATARSEGELDRIIEDCVSKILPEFVPAKEFFIFVEDEKRKFRYWHHSSTGKSVRIPRTQLFELSEILKRETRTGRRSFWEDCDIRMIGGAQPKSTMVVPIPSSVLEAGKSGYIVIRDALHNTSFVDHECEIRKPFSKEQENIAQDLAEKLSSLLDIYLHEHQRQNLTQLLAHEILTPAIYVRNTAIRLGNKLQKLDRMSKNELANIQHTADLQVAICSGIFFANDIRAGFFQKYEPTEVRVHQMFREWQRILHPICENYGLPYENISVDLSIRPLFIDMRALQVVFLNLAVNALKYSSDSGFYDRSFKLRVRSNIHYGDVPNSFPERLRKPKFPSGLKNNGFYVLSFEDEGIGIPKEYRERVFEQYFRVQVGPDLFRPGMGVGLSMVRQISRDFFGETWVDRCSGPTRLNVALPMLLENDAYLAKI